LNDRSLTPNRDEFL